MEIVPNSDLEKIKLLLNQVNDPEVPVLSINDLGVLRDVTFVDGVVNITITPTYSGCPAMFVIEEDIKKILANNGFTSVNIKTVLSPAWTTSWMSEEGKRKLEAYGIAPPVEDSEDKSQLFAKPKIIKCPRCKSMDTQLVSQFGSTACKALYKCKACKEPFDYFKCL